MLVKVWPLEPLIYAAIVAILLLFRLVTYLQKRWSPPARATKRRDPSPARVQD
jgi:DMSO/TMAO reductase YedYZ heme-binding membrane subunit